MNEYECTLAWIPLLAAAYFAPWIVAGIRNTKNRNWVAIVTVFFGWTLIGWIAALAMAIEGERSGHHTCRKGCSH